MNAGEMVRLGLFWGGFTASLGAAAIPARAGTESIIHTFTFGRDGAHPSAALVKVGSKLYGTTNTSVFEVTTKGKFHVLHRFSGTNEGEPHSLLNVGGLLYGTTQYGGAGACGGGCGTVYTLTLQGTKNVIYTFQGDTDGFEPGGLLSVGGLLYGTTLYGGAYQSGTAFKLTPQGTETVLYGFGRTTEDGRMPEDLIYAGGVFYGTTLLGGNVDNGTVFKLSKAGAEKVITPFSTGADSYLIDIGGILYGTEGAPGYGDVFALTRQGVKTIIYSFQGRDDGSFPSDITNVGGKIYGITSGGGGSGCNGGGCGTVFSLTVQGEYTLIYAFKGPPDGWLPLGSVLNVDGVLYGTTALGGDMNCRRHLGCGTIYAIKP